ncbi:MAG TPA: condensation domain-containing protein, partial [Pyrinomonadaceae bacterium]|nr:condensation domain-containing protein [Pyrinomonadaceae bacterium]
RVRQGFNVEIPLRTIFEMPTVASLAEHVDSSRAAKLSLQAPPIVPVLRDRELPASFAQERLWFLEQLEPGDAALNIRKAIRLKGELDVDALERSLREIVRRHECLRTTFAMVDGRPVQTIAPEVSFHLELFDLSDWPSEQREAEAQLLARQEAELAFDLTEGPIVRGRLLRLSDDEHICVLVLHHIAADGWSMGVFYRELSLLYKAFSMGESSPLEDLPVQYADFAVWQREWLQGEVLAEQLGYWKQQLSDAPVLELPADIPRPEVQTYSGAVKSFLMPRHLLDAIREMCQREGVTVYMMLLVAFKLLLARYSGQQDIVVGSPIANRNRTETEGLIGFFVNTLPMRTSLAGDPTFRELLARVRETALGAYVHQDAPYESIVREVQPERRLSHNPLYQVMFVLQNAPVDRLDLPGLKLAPMAIEGEMVKLDQALSQEQNVGSRGSDVENALVDMSRTVGQQLDLMVSMRETKAGLIGTMRYNADVFFPTTIARMLEHFEVLIRSIVANVDRRISQLPLLADTERRKLLVEWNDTERSFSATDKCIHELFEEQVARTPSAVAVVHEGESLSYAELNERANQVAHYLVAQGVTPDEVVGLSMERSLELVVAMLGVLKAGAAYLPLDPGYPEERRQYMLTDAQVELVLTRAAVAEVLEQRTIGTTVGAARCGRPWVNPERVATEGHPYSCALKDPTFEAVEPGNLAYVIYTSGSTGRPKGVGVPHAALVNFVAGASEAYGISSRDRVLQFASVSFDTSAEEIYPCLTRGATLVLRSEQMISTAAEFLRSCMEQQVTVLDLPTAYWHE